MNFQEIKKRLDEAGKQRIAKETGNIYFRRSTKLITPDILWDSSINEGSLNNDDWAYKVGYCFRSALDISLETRYKNKKPKQIWTQGHLINFTRGDTFTARSGHKSLQVQEADSMRWMPNEHSLDMGFITYSHLTDENGLPSNIPLTTVSQIQFLKILVTGIE